MCIRHCFETAEVVTIPHPLSASLNTFPGDPLRVWPHQRGIHSSHLVFHSCRVCNSTRTCSKHF
jgi:hypothetical protein